MLIIVYDIIIIIIIFIIIRLYLLTNIITMFMIPMQQALHPFHPVDTNAHLTNHCYKNSNAVASVIL